MIIKQIVPNIFPDEKVLIEDSEGNKSFEKVILYALDSTGNIFQVVYRKGEPFIVKSGKLIRLNNYF